MGYGIKVVGMQRALSFINREVEKKNRAFRAGLIAAGLELERAATLQITEVLYSQPEPKDKARKRTGNLRASRYTVWTQGPTRGAPNFKDTYNDAEDQTSAFEHALAQSKGEVDSRNKAHFAVIVGYGASYALFVHEGTSRMEGYHWLSDALNTNKQHLIDIVRAYTKDSSGIGASTDLTPSGDAT